MPGRAHDIHFATAEKPLRTGGGEDLFGMTITYLRLDGFQHE